MKKIYLLSAFLLILNTIKSQSISFNYAKQIGNSGNDVGRAVTTDTNGNVYVTGYFNGTLDFDPGVGTFTMSSFGLEDVFIMKLDASGNFVWAKQIGGTGEERGHSVSLDGSGNIYMSGQFVGTCDFDPGVIAYNLTSVGGTQEDAFFLKLDPSGNFIWAKQIGGSFNDYSYSIFADASGSCYSTGSFNGTVDFDPGASTFTISSVSPQCYILKLNSSGNFLWAKSFNNISSSTSNLGQGITVDISGNVYTTGNFSGTVDFDPNASTITLTALGQSDVFISKLDNSGNYVWAKSFSGLSSEEGTSIAVDVSGNVYTTGIFGNSVDFDPSGVIYNLTSGGIRNVFISKLNSLGNFVWAKQIGGTSSDDRGYSITLDVFSNVYVAGSFNGVGVDFDPSGASYTLTSISADNDIFVTKLDAGGNFIWAKAMQGPMDDKANGVAVDNNGSVYTTGSFNGTVDFDPNATTYTLTNPSVSGIPDIFICKLSCQTPTITAVSSSSMLCAGKSTTLTAGGASSYTWNPFGTGASIVVSPTVTTSYTVTGTNTLGCSGTNTISVTVVANPIINIVSSSSVICTGETTTLTASGASTYTWSTLANGNSISISPTVNTNYTVSGTDNNGCTNASILTQTVFACIGIKEINNGNDFVKLYPNPNNGQFYFKGISKTSTIEVFDINGRLVYSAAINEENQMIDLSGKPKGIYLYKVKDSNDKIQNGKLINE